MLRRFIIPLGLLAPRNYQHLMQVLLPHFSNNEEQAIAFVKGFWPGVARMNEGEITGAQFVKNVINLAKDKYNATLAEEEILKAWAGMEPDLESTVKDIKATLMWAEKQGDEVTFYSSSNANDIRQVIGELKKDEEIRVDEIDFGYSITIVDGAEKTEGPRVLKGDEQPSFVFHSDVTVADLRLSYKCGDDRETLVTKCLQQNDGLEACLVLGPEVDFSIPFPGVQGSMTKQRESDLKCASSNSSEVLTIESFTPGEFAEALEGSLSQQVRATDSPDGFFSSEPDKTREAGGHSPSAKSTTGSFNN